MAVKTDFSKVNLEGIISSYNLGNLRKFRPLKLGAVQTNILLETTKKVVVFRYYESRSERYAFFEVILLRHLNKHNYPCPLPISNAGGDFLGTYKGKPFVLFDFMEGLHRKKSNPRLIAQAIGRLHKITIGYKPKNYEFRDSYDQKSCWKTALLNSKKIKSRHNAKERLDWLKVELSQLQIPKTLPKGVCHCDTHPSNFLYKNNKLVSVLDFDDASYIYLLYDIANMIYFWAWPHRKRIIFGNVKYIVKTYEKYRNLTEEEKFHLYDLLKMVIFMSIGWFIHSEDYYDEKKKIELLNSIGRQEFYNRIFG